MTSTDSRTQTLSLHPLTYVEEPDGVMVGRPETGSYALFPADGAAAVRRLAAGEGLAQVGEWYERTYGSPLDLADLAEMLVELDFVRTPGHPDPTPVRWTRVGRWLFSVPAWLAYMAITAAGLVFMVADPGLRPSYRHLFFTSHLSLINVGLALGQFPCMALHEGFHALAGRRLGLPSTFGVGRRFYYLVVETRLDSLYSVPRRQRYLPFLAGMLIDIVLVCALTVAAGLLARTGWPAWIGGYLLALAFTGVLRLLWQFLFYLETDLYFVIATALRCTDLQSAAHYVLRRFWLGRLRLGRLLRRAVPNQDEEWTVRDLAMARRYAPLLVVGYAFSLATLLWAGLPATLRFATTLWHRLDGSVPLTTGAVVDTVVFVAITGTQLGLLGYVTIRDWRAKRAARRPLEQEPS